MTLPVDHLSHSQAGAMRDCLRLLEYRYVKKLPKKVQPLNMALGRVVHATAAADYTNRKTKGLYLPDEAIPDLASTAFSTETLQVRWGIEESSPGDALDDAIGMARAHHRDVAPTVRPVEIEHTMRAAIRGLPVVLLGVADVIAEGGATITATKDGATKTLRRAGKHIRDTKTSKKAPHGVSGGHVIPDDRNMAQLATYRIIAAANGEPAVDSWLDYVWPTKGGQSLPCHVDVTPNDVRLVLEDYAALVRCYETGLFPRTGRGSWICKPGKCDYYDECILGISRVADL